MEKNKKMMLFIFLAIAYFFLMTRNKNTEPEKVNYKTGVFYEKIAIKKGNFITNFISSFKKQEPTTLNDADILKITYAEDKIENIQIEKATLLAGKEEDAQKFFDSIIKEQNLNSKELVISENLKGIANNLLRTIETSRTKAISSLKTKKSNDKLKPGAFSTIVKNEENNQFMEVTMESSDIRINKITVTQNNLAPQSIELIDKKTEAILNNQVKTLAEETSTDAGYNTFIKGVNEIQDQLQVESLVIIPKKSNIVWQSIKDIIAGIINFTYKVVKNYGVAIIIATIIIKILLLPLTLKQDKSMKEMKKLQPKLDKIKEQYKNDPQMMNQKTMEIYKENKINPAGGCLPLLIQMPILIALFGVLRSGIVPEIAKVIRETINFNTNTITNLINGVLVGPKFLWLDLVNPDPFYILPILTGAVTYLQQKAMGTGGAEENPMMKNMSVMMPLMMVFIALKMPSGVQLYWLISTALAVVQQRWIMKKGE